MTNKLKAIVTIGAPASGKTTYANTFSWSEWDTLERDQIRKMICTSSEHQLISPRRHDFNAAYYALPKETINKIESLVNEEINKRIDSRESNIILSNTNLSTKHRNALVRNLKQKGYEVSIIVFNPSLDILLKRDASRMNNVGVRVLVDMWQRLQHQLQDIKKLGRDEKVSVEFEYNSSLIYNNGQKQDNCIIVDLDGTVAHNPVGADGKYRRGWYVEDCSTDDFDDVVFYMAYALSIKFNADIVFLTGRNVKSWESSKQWLDKHLQSYALYHNNGYQLYSRGAHDHRKDSDAKRDMYDTFIDGRYEKVIAVFDDRNQMVDMWTDMGLKVINCGDYRDTF